MNGIVQAILKKYWKVLSKKKNVIGYDGELKPRVRDGKEYYSEPCFRIYVTKKEPLSALRKKDIIPKLLTIKGTDIGLLSVTIPVPTDVYPVGIHKALHKKVKIGTSGCHYLCTACTVGGYARSTVKGEEDVIGILSNNHCCALENRANLGDAYLVPSPIDGGLYPDDKIASLYRFVPLEKNCIFRNFFSKLFPFLKKDKTNKVDIGFCSLDKLEFMDNSVHKIGKIKGKRRGNIGELAHKYGRTSGYTKNAILITNNYYGYVYYDIGKLFFGPVGLLEKEYFALRGDSSSAIIWMKDNYLAGYLFAGSNNTSLFCHYDLVEELLHVEILV